MKNRKAFIQELQQQVVVMGVSKNRSLDEINDLYKEGITIFGENKVQELRDKFMEDQPWQWHFIGHLQKNKVKYVVKMVSMIHSVDSIELVDVIEKHAAKLDKVINVLIQVNVVSEKSKFGCSLNQVEELVNHIEQCRYVTLKGFMSMGPASQDEELIKEVFIKTNQLFEHYKKTHATIDTLSMGMSSDYKLAIKYGSTIVRIGSLLFNYSKNTHPQ